MFEQIILASVLCNTLAPILADTRQTISLVEEEHMLSIDCPSSQKAIDTVWLLPSRHVLVSPGFVAAHNLTTEESDPDHHTLFSSRHHSLNSQPNDHCLVSDGHQDTGRIRMLANSTLILTDTISHLDVGQYICLGVVGSNQTWTNLLEDAPLAAQVVQDLHMRDGIYSTSLYIALLSSVIFTVLMFAVKFTAFVLYRVACCSCCGDGLSPRSKQFRTTLDSIDVYRQQQKKRLIEAYNQQYTSICENCSTRMEQLRDNYQQNVQNLRDMSLFGPTRDQYYDAMATLRDYSYGQVERLHENYMVQRARLRKFSAYHYLRMRERGKTTQRTLLNAMQQLQISRCREPDVDTDGDDIDLDERRAKIANLAAAAVASDPFLVDKQSNLVVSPDRMVHSTRPSTAGPARRGHRKCKSFSGFLPTRLFCLSQYSPADVQATAMSDLHPVEDSIDVSMPCSSDGGDTISAYIDAD